MSVAKSIVSILVGIALDDGLISSLDDPVGKYALKIKNSPYGSLPIRSLLQMSSGVPFVEQYPVKSKTDIYDFAVEAQYGKNSSIIRAINNIKKQSNGYGKVFNYASVETAVLVEVLRSASKQSLCSFMQERLWKPIGAEHDANWNIDSEGLEWGFGWLNATQADLAKVGILLTNGGEINGKQVVSKKYLEEATSLEKQPLQFKKVNDVNEPSKNAGYVYQFWLTDTPGRFFMQGIFGQYVVIDQPSKTVMIINSADTSFLSDNRTKETLKVFGKLLEQNF
jgi:CubicO group peptidase (beta-lactamase class C family)